MTCLVCPPSLEPKIDLVAVFVWGVAPPGKSHQNQRAKMKKAAASKANSEQKSPKCKTFTQKRMSQLWKMTICGQLNSQLWRIRPQTAPMSSKTTHQTSESQKNSREQPWAAVGFLEVVHVRSKKRARDIPSPSSVILPGQSWTRKRVSC